MPPSQLKQLKNSLRQNGLSNSSQSKKRKREDGDRGGGAQDRAQRQAVLNNLRENFRPFDKKTSSRPRKFQALSLDDLKSKNRNGIIGRPGLSKARGEELVCCDFSRFTTERALIFCV